MRLDDQAFAATLAEKQRRYWLAPRGQKLTRYEELKKATLEDLKRGLAKPA